MSFTGKATYTAGSTLPEIAEDVSDLIAINSPHETPLLDALGDPARLARSTVHDWLEDALVPNTDVISSFDSGAAEMTVDNVSRFRVGDQLRVVGSSEVVMVDSIDSGASTVHVVRGYGGTTPETIDDGSTVNILGNAALEGDDASSVRFTTRSRLVNYTQIFSATVEVSGSELAVRQIGVRDELDYQKNQRTRELLRDLENCVINGVAAAATPEGSGTVRRTMRGLLSFVQSNRFSPGSGIPSGDTLSEIQLNTALREIWKSSSGQVDLIVVGGPEKRAINSFIASNRRFTASDESFKDLVSVYESDFGVCRVVLSRWVPAGSVLLLDSSRIEVMPLSARSFHYKPLATTGDRESGQIVGEYTLELRNENAHGVISGLGL
ncbi:MAG: SU10 major capsid protein [Tepidisphaeraceae bacterium]